MKEKLQSKKSESCENPVFGLSIVERENMLQWKDAGYKRAKIGGEYVVLYDPRREDDEIVKSTIIDTQMDLNCDLDKAFSQFSVTETRLLVKLLVLGQSMDKATARMKKSREYWRTWYMNVALPKLRESLSAYYENGKVVV